MGKVLTTNEFNEKYKDYLDDGHYGLDISIPSVVSYLDEIFEGMVKIPGFKYSQVKLKFNMCRFYTNLYDVLGKTGGKLSDIIEKDINFLVKVDDEVRKQLKEMEG